jgi:predicted solute-binding protein
VKYAYQESPHSIKHSLPTQRNKKSEREYAFIRILISNKITQLRKTRTIGVTTLEWSVAKQFATGGTNLTLAPTGSHINKQVQIVLVK